MIYIYKLLIEQALVLQRFESMFFNIQKCQKNCVKSLKYMSLKNQRSQFRGNSKSFHPYKHNSYIKSPNCKCLIIIEIKNHNF